MVGALLVTAFEDDGPPAVAETAAVATPTPADADRLRAGIAAVLPAVVNILAVETSNAGTGVVIADGVVLTNYHVVEGARTITVALATGEERPATLIADDSPFQDAALLRVDGRGLRVAPLGTSAGLALGDPVAVISGGVFQYQLQAKVGVVSAVDAAFPYGGVVLDRVIQTDAAVNHGDSGSPLVDASGQVVGLITSVVREDTGEMLAGVSFAQSIDALRPFVDAVLQTGVNPRPRLGIERIGRQHVPLDDRVAAEMGLPVTRGAAIMHVSPESPAEEAGIRPGDVVVAVNGTEVTLEAPFPNLLGAVPTGVEVRLTVLRGGQTVNVTVLPRPASPGTP